VSLKAETEIRTAMQGIPPPFTNRLLDAISVRHYCTS
jgi:hypothetical protein